MSFELKTVTDPEGKDSEVIEETIIKSEQVIRTWSKNTIQKEILDLQTQIEEAQSRKTILEEQLARFGK